jgi:YbgC/YbaW family acyl-CoA thioester hydrolase
MPSIYTTFHRVRSYELDSFGHVNNAIFLNYLEYARGEYLLQKGLSFQDFHRWNALPIVVQAEITYKSPATVHDFLEISGSISVWRKASFVLEYKILNQTTNRLSAKAKMEFAFVSREQRLVPIPDEFKNAMV